METSKINIEKYLSEIENTMMKKAQELSKEKRISVFDIILAI